MFFRIQFSTFLRQFAWRAEICCEAIKYDAPLDAAALADGFANWELEYNGRLRNQKLVQCLSHLQDPSPSSAASQAAVEKTFLVNTTSPFLRISHPVVLEIIETVRVLRETHGWTATCKNTLNGHGDVR